MGGSSTRAFAVAFAVCSWCAHAFGFPTSRLTYARGTGAEACPEEPIVRQAVAARLGYDPFFAAADKTIVARILRNRDELRATVELVDDRGMVRGVREVKAPAGQCGELVATMALAISIAIDPTNPGIGGDTAKARAEPPRPTPAALETRPPPRPHPPAPAPEPPEVDAPEKPDQPPSSFELRVGGAVIGAVATAPAATLGLGLSAGFRSGIWSLAGEARSELPGSTEAGAGRVRTSLWAGGIAPCIHFDPLLVCATTWVGSLRAQGVGFVTSYIHHALYAAAGLRLGMEIPLFARLSFRPELDVLTTLFPVDLKVDGESHWAAPPFSALLRVGIVARFP
ncbi:MAG TPA: hypothetical protein VK550_23555 [Polyangiaceae bacterium]|nr:hypothetical protein [Polyangiaceae bacterium]